MAYRPVRIHNGNVPTDNATATLYTVPAGETLVVTNISVASANGEIGPFSLYLGQNDSTGGHGGLVHHNSGLAVSDQLLFHGLYVVNAGDVVNLSSTTGALNTYVQATGVVGTGTFEGGTPWRLSQNVVATGDTIGYTVPAGRTLVIKTMVITNPGGTSTAAVRIGSTPVMPYYASYVTGQSLQVDGSFVANAGENILLNIGTAAAVGQPGVSFYMSGVLY